MANPEHLERLKQGAEEWNEWSKQHPEILPELRGADLAGADLSNAYLSRANLDSANLRGADLTGTYLRGAYLGRARLNRANLNRATLDSANLSYANLSYAYLSGAYLSRAYLSRATLDSANLSRADLVRADLSRATLDSAILSGAILSGAILSGASLSGASLSGASLSGADLSHALLRGTIFANLDLRHVKGLPEIKHEGPSHIDLHSIQLPQDGSALHFLRGAGVPEEWIDFWRSTAMSVIQYHSLFISYSNKDETLARRLHADLQAQGVRCWFAPEDLKIGDRFHTRINEAIHVQDKLLLLISEHSIESPWVEIEVRATLEKEQRQHRDVLFPIRLDKSVIETTQAWAAMLRQSRHIGDFTRWKDHDEYQKSFQRLLRDLKQEAIHDTIESDADQD